MPVSHSALWGHIGAFTLNRGHRKVSAYILKARDRETRFTISFSAKRLAENAKKYTAQLTLSFHPNPGHFCNKKCYEIFNYILYYEKIPCGHIFFTYILSRLEAVFENLSAPYQKPCEVLLVIISFEFECICFNS